MQRIDESLTKTIEDVLERIESDDSFTQQSAVEDLVKIGKLDVNSLIYEFLMNTEGLYIDGLIAEALGCIGDTRAVEPLVLYLEKYNYLDREYGDAGAAEILEALGKLGDVRAVKPLIKALDSWHWELRKESAIALGKIGDKQALNPLKRALKDERENPARKNNIIKHHIREAIERLSQ